MDKEPKYRARGPAEWLTVPGRLLLMVSLMGGCGLFCGYFLATWGSLPDGSYPVFIWVAPVGAISFIFFFGVAFIFEVIGVRIYRNDRET